MKVCPLTLAGPLAGAAGPEAAPLLTAAAGAPLAAAPPLAGAGAPLPAGAPRAAGPPFAGGALPVFPAPPAGLAAALAFSCSSFSFFSLS